jgi:C4-type Zn-finger protein
MKEYIGKINGTCPVCGRKISFYSMTIEGNILECNFKCKGCKSDGTEYYTLVYNKTIAYKRRKNEKRK